MKRCPQCNRVESDNALTFCRVDGTALVQESIDEDSGTIRFNSSSVFRDAPTTVLSTATTDADITPAQQTTVLPSQRGNSRPLARRKTPLLIVAG